MRKQINYYQKIIRIKNIKEYINKVIQEREIDDKWITNKFAISWRKKLEKIIISNLKKQLSKKYI